MGVAQTDYLDQGSFPALEGGVYDNGPNDVVSRTPGANVAQISTLTLTTGIAAVAEVQKITITTAADADVFHVFLNGHEVATGTSSGTDKTVQRDALQALLLADAYFVANFTWTDSSTDAGIITALNPGEGFDLFLTIDATSVWTISTNTENVVGTFIKLTINGIQYVYPCGSTTEATETAALLAVLLADTRLTNLVTVTNPTATTVVFTAIEAGVPFSISLVNANRQGQPGSGTVSLATGTANVTGNPVPFGRAVARTTTVNKAILPAATGFSFEGVTVNRAKALPQLDNPLATGTAQYNAGETMPVMRKGRIWVIPETTGALTASVYVRHTQGAAPEATPGRFRATDDSGKVDVLTGARWVTVPTAGELAVIELP